MTIGKVRQSAVNAITEKMIHRSFKPLSCWEAIEEAPSQSTLLSNLGSRTNSTFDISLISYLLFFSDKRYKSERYWRQKTFVANIWNCYHTHGWLNRQYCGFWSYRTLPYFPLSSSVRSSVIGVTYRVSQKKHSYKIFELEIMLFTCSQT